MTSTQSEPANNAESPPSLPIEKENGDGAAGVAVLETPSQSVKDASTGSGQQKSSSPRKSYGMSFMDEWNLNQRKKNKSLELSKEKTKNEMAAFRKGMVDIDSSSSDGSSVGGDKDEEEESKKVKKVKKKSVGPKNHNAFLMKQKKM